jgi:hypothetical protein
MKQTLPVTGEYKIVVCDSTTHYTGGYDIYLERLNNPSQTTPIVFGQTISGSIDPYIEVDIYTFSANAGDTVIIRVRKTSGSLCPYVRLYAPDMEFVEDDSSCSALEMKQTLPVTGEYKIVVCDSTTHYTGGYDIYLERLNNSPNTPFNPSPANHATGVPIDADLSWTGGDPDAGDSVTYDVYFDTTDATTLVVSGQSSTTYSPPGILNYNTTYYWKVVAQDNHGATTSGPLWDFTTVPEGVTPVNISMQPATMNVGVGEVFDLVIQAEAGDQPVSGTSAFIDFDPAYLEVQSVTPGASLSTVVQNTYNNTAGTIDYGAGKLGEPFPTGTFTVATIHFKALAISSPSTSITFSTSVPRETRVDYAGNDVTGTITGATVFVSEATVDISVVLQGGSRPPEGWEVPITIKFFSPGADVMTDTPIYEFNLTTTKSDGTATCQCAGVMPGTYDITAVSEHTLINIRGNVIISGPSTTVDMGTLLEGNANDDSIINISDFGILAVSYMKTEGEPGYDARADFDRNGIINISDFGLLAVNYMEMSPVDIS